jgi:hypothetical protein
LGSIEVTTSEEMQSEGDKEMRRLLVQAAHACAYRKLIRSTNSCLFWSFWQYSSVPVARQNSAEAA